MNYRAVSATVVAAAIAAFVLVLTGSTLLPIAADLLPIPRIVPAPLETVVVDTERRPEATSPTNSAPAGDSASPGTPASGGSSSVPGSSSGSAGAPAIVTTRFGYVGGGQVVLSLGWARDATTAVERQLATLSYGSCEGFGPWEPASTTDQLPPGSCAAYRVLVEGEVVYELPELARYDGTQPIVEDLDVTEEGAREHVIGSTLYVAAGADELRPVSVAATASDPESGLASVAFATGETSITVTEAPWQTELIPERGSISVTALNTPGGETTSEVAVVADGEGPSGGFVDYASEPGPDGTVHVDFSAGTDAGSGVDAGTLERRGAPLTSSGCGEYGGWNDASADERLPEGRCFQYRYHVRDNVGNETIYSSQVEVAVADDTAPTTAIVSPDDGSVLSGTVDVVAEADDEGSGLRSVAIQVRGAGHEDWTTLETGSGSSVTAAWDTLSVKPGCYLLRAVAEDRTGNVTESEPVEVIVAADTTAPSAAIVSPTEGTTVSGSTTVEAEAADAESGLESVTIQVRRACRDWSDLATFSSGPFTTTWDTSVLEPGRYQLRVVATDRRGNKFASDPVVVTVEALVEPPPVEPPSEPPADDSGAGEGEDAGAEEPAAEEPPASPEEPTPPAADSGGESLDAAPGEVVSPDESGEPGNGSEPAPPGLEKAHSSE
jgi:Big-like domain-containing protein